MERVNMSVTREAVNVEVLFFQERRPETTVNKGPASKYEEIGVPAAVVPVSQKAGYYTVASMKDAAAQKLHQEICGLNKKYKLNLENPSVGLTYWWGKKKQHKMCHNYKMSNYTFHFFNMLNSVNEQ